MPLPPPMRATRDDISIVGFHLILSEAVGDLVETPRCGKTVTAVSHDGQVAFTFARSPELGRWCFTSS